MSTKNIVNNLISRGIESSFLDSAVHAEYSKMASETNNEGLKAQVEFLMTECGYSETDIMNAALY